MRIREWMQCARKICHTDFYSAYLHKRGLLRLNPHAEIDIYPCDYCGGLHVGNQLTVLQAERGLKKLDEMMQHQNFELKTPEITKKFLKDKKEHLENFLKYERD